MSASCFRSLCEAGLDWLPPHAGQCGELACVKYRPPSLSGQRTGFILSYFHHMTMLLSSPSPLGSFTCLVERFNRSLDEQLFKALICPGNVVSSRDGQPSSNLRSGTAVRSKNFVLEKLYHMPEDTRLQTRSKLTPGQETP
ncbi:hypothetical protein CHS0354_020147 [Potamilus streckersoni]|uniref:Uncharacterized protein n=1 Tax=Potamilus streckersoni TaxID=2493646 RepID=A0AAE0S5Q7_9BIVA|nr:hypothetical protein CHS0354_020147 [Potamilus streckersoni]